MSSTAPETKSNRTAIYVSLGLAVLLVLGVVIGARVYFNRVAFQPVAMSEIPSPMADSEECAKLIDEAPATLLGKKRAEIAEPAPAGVAAWQSSSTERITLRCGVDIPAQYTEYALTDDIDGVQWLRVDDITEGSQLSTWYSVDRSPVLAVTADRSQLRDGATPVAGIGAEHLPQEQATPNTAPLSQLAQGDPEKCAMLLDAAPPAIAEGYEQVTAVSPNTVAWAAEGRDPIVLRCGVAEPERYAPGVQLVQVNDIPWFEDVILANGTTASTWYALGRDTVVAASMPQIQSNEAITNLSNLIAEHTEGQ